LMGVNTPPSTKKSGSFFRRNADASRKSQNFGQE
jgi:hypothetical protein